MLVTAVVELAGGVIHNEGKTGLFMKNGNAIAIYDIAAKHLTTVQVCVDRLHELGADHESKLLALSTGALLLVCSSAQALPLTYDVDISDFASPTFAAAHTAKQKCINTCRARYRDCLSLKQIPSSECRGIYQDCTRYTCNAGADGRPSWPGFPGEP